MNSPPSLCSLSFSPPLLPSSSIIPAAQWMNRADSRERFFLYQTGVHYSRVCETRPGFTILIRSCGRLVHVCSIFRSIERTRAVTTIVFHRMTIFPLSLHPLHVCARSLLSYISFSFFMLRFSYPQPRLRVNRIE